jgi:hypothetical protein
LVNTLQSFTRAIKATGFGFDALIPEDATIDGISATIRAKDNADATDWNAVRLLVGGSQAGDNKASSLSTLTRSLADYTAGGSDDTWGTTLDASDIRAADFGLKFSFMRGGKDATVSVDAITIEVAYTPSTSAFRSARTLPQGAAGSFYWDNY